MGYYEDLKKAFQKKKEFTIDRLKKEADERQKALLSYLGGHGILYGGQTGKGLSQIEETLARGIGETETEFALKEAEIGTRAEQERKGRIGSLLKTLGTVGGGLVGVGLAPFSGGLSLALPTIMAGMGIGSAVGGLGSGLAGLGGAESVPSDILGALESLSSREFDELYKQWMNSLIQQNRQGKDTTLLR